MSKWWSVCVGVLVLAVPSVAAAQNAPSAARARLTARAQRQPTPALLCQLGEMDRAEGDLAAARQHLEEGLQRPMPRAVTALGRRTALFQCHLSLAQVHAAQNRLDDAWVQVAQAWNDGEALPAARAEAAVNTYVAIGRQRWRGEHCADQWQLSNIEEAESTVLQLLVRGDDVGLRQCLNSIRARSQPEHRGVCRPLAAPPRDMAPWAPNAAGWTTVAPQVGAASGDMAFLVGRTENGSPRYVECQHGMSEYSATYTGARLGDNLTALVARVEPCGEDLAAGERCPVIRTAYLVDHSTGTAAGVFTLSSPTATATGATAFASPFGEVSAAQPFTAEGSVIRVGNARLTLVRGVLVPAP